MFNFGRKVKRVARRQYRRGLLDSGDYERIKVGCRDPETVKRWQEAVEKGVPGAPWLVAQGPFGIDWSAVWEWFLENWPTILKILLTLLAFVAEEPKSDSMDEEEVE